MEWRPQSSAVCLLVWAKKVFLACSDLEELQRCVDDI